MGWTAKVAHFGDDYANVEVAFTGEGDAEGFVYGDLRQFFYGGVKPNDPSDNKLEDAEIAKLVPVWKAECDAALKDWREKRAYEDRFLAALGGPHRKSK